jgi:putative heme-binding domain-containing protein
MIAGSPTHVASADVPRPAEDYNQWKEALGTNTATAATQVTPLPGFAVDLVRSAQPGEGSWVAMTFDPHGRIIIAREDRGLLRLTLPASGRETARVETINTNLLECRGLLFAYDALYANANNSRGLYRLRDTLGIDQFDEVTLLKSTPGGLGHGRNQLALGPDGMIYSIHGDDVRLPPEGVAPSSPFTGYGEDRLLGTAWDDHLFSSYVKVPCGHLIRTDRDGRSWEIIAGGFRNPFGIAFNTEGELFTFDADMEWDVGLPWYHPTRVLHILPGGDYGWRRGTGVLPAWSPDTLPSVVDVGLSSPTAVMFGTKSHFPEPYRSALFALDWAYGRILAVHLTPTNSTYTGRFEVFLKGRPLNVTGLDFGPHDGAMYFVTGGRRTQSGLYRVRALKPDRVAQAPRSDPSASDRAARRELEHLRGRNDARTLDTVWTTLRGDRWIQYTARTTLETLPTQAWQERALSSSSADLAAQPAALLALARVGGYDVQSRMRERALVLLSGKLATEQTLLALRALAVSYCRHGRPDKGVADRTAAILDHVYPSDDWRVNEQLCELLVYLEAPNVVRKTMPLIASAATQEEKIQYLFLLRLARNGWTSPERRTYFETLQRGRAEFQGAHMLLTFLNYIRSDAEATLTAAERSALGDLLRTIEEPVGGLAPPAAPRPLVREWVVNDFADALKPVSSSPHDPARGRRLFQEMGCAQCHRLGREGGFIGPDLTAVGSRFDRRTLLESILEPSKVIAEPYRAVSLTLKSGAILDGRIAAEDPETVTVVINPVDPDQQRRVRKSEIIERRASDVSPMPAGLVNGFTKEEILELVGFLESFQLRDRK